MAAFDAGLRAEAGGLYCPAGDFWVDPTRPVARAVVTHGHADHARPGMGEVIATPETLAIMAMRMGAERMGAPRPLAYGETLKLGSARLRLAPAGHVLGSAQAVIEVDGATVVVSGDYKRRRDPTCAPFEPVACDLFVTEATFALPVFRHPPDAGEIAKLAAAAERAGAAGRAVLVGAYSLGKAQRLIMRLREAGWTRPIHLHGAMRKLCDLYVDHGLDLGELIDVGERPKSAFMGEIVLAPPSALNDRWSRRLPDPITAFASGWMGVRARARQRGVELPLVISDHADWDELTQTLSELRPAETWITHGRDDALAHWAAQNGLNARPLRLAEREEEADDGS